VVEHPAEGDVPAHSVSLQLLNPRGQQLMYVSPFCRKLLFYRVMGTRNVMSIPRPSVHLLSIMLNW
jgi:hypothetical protein